MFSAWKCGYGDVFGFKVLEAMQILRVTGLDNTLWNYILILDAMEWELNLPLDRNLVLTLNEESLVQIY